MWASSAHTLLLIPMEITQPMEYGGMKMHQDINSSQLYQKLRYN
jgi:hypothetical protein